MNQAQGQSQAFETIENYFASSLKEAKLTARFEAKAEDCSVVPWDASSRGSSLQVAGTAL